MCTELSDRDESGLFTILEEVPYIDVSLHALVRNDTKLEEMGIQY